MREILYNAFGEKFIAFLLLILILETILIGGFGIFMVIKEMLSLHKPRPKK